MPVTHVAAEQPVHRRGGFHITLDGLDRGELVVGLGVIECVLKLALELVVRREYCAFGLVALGVELEQFVGHVLHGLADASLGLGPLLRAELVELRRGACVRGTVFLDEVEARKRDVELGGLGEFENHELDGETVLHNLFQALILRDAMLDMHDIIADGEVAEVRDKGRGLRLLRLDARCYVGFVGEIVCAKENQPCIRQAHAGGNRRAQNHRHARIVGEVTCLFQHSLTARLNHAATQPVGNLILAQHRCHALDIALMRRGNYDACIRFHQPCESVR